MHQPSHPWGEPVWSFPVPIPPRPLTDGMHVDLAVIGAGFTGLATAHYVLQGSPGLRVAVFESQQVGAGASGRTGGLVLEDTAVGPLPGVEDCIATLQELVRTQSLACDLQISACWEIGRQRGQATSPIQWADHGTLRVVKVIPGGVFDPRKFLAGLAEVVQRAGGDIFEQAPIANLDMKTSGPVRLTVADKTVHAARVVFATNAFCLGLLGLQRLGRRRAHHCSRHRTTGRRSVRDHWLGHAYAFLYPGYAVPVGAGHCRGAHGHWGRAHGAWTGRRRPC